MPTTCPKCGVVLNPSGKTHIHKTCGTCLQTEEIRKINQKREIQERCQREREARSTVSYSGGGGGGGGGGSGGGCVGFLIFAALIVGGGIWGWGKFDILKKNATKFISSPTSESPAETPKSSSSSDDPFAEPRPVPPVRPTTESIATPDSPKTNPREITTARPAPEAVDNPREKTSSKPDSEGIKPNMDSVQLKVAELKGELAALDAKIQGERQRWQEGVNVINRLTNFKKTPVREGSPQYHQCMAASRVIQEVEAGAPALKAEKARLEAMIRSLESK